MGMADWMLNWNKLASASWTICEVSTGYKDFQAVV
jgi:hypothetical protein